MGKMRVVIQGTAEDRKRVHQTTLDNGTLIIVIDPPKKEEPEKQTIFHGGCIGCTSQKRFGIERCNFCQYCRANWNLPDLHC